MTLFISSDSAKGVKKNQRVEKPELRNQAVGKRCNGGS